MAITYPINDSDRFTVYNTETGEPLADGNGRKMTRRAWGSEDKSQMIQGLADNIKWLIETTQDKPTYDSMTHKLEQAIVYDVANEEARTEYSVTALTQAEIDERTPEHFETDGGIKMATDLQSQAAFSNMMTLLNEAGMADSDMVAIKDCFGVSHPLTVTQFRADAVAYGLFCYQAFHAE